MADDEKANPGNTTNFGNTNGTSAMLDGRYICRIQALSNSHSDDTCFQEALRRQEWLVAAAEDSSEDRAVRSLAADLKFHVREGSPQQTRKAALQLIEAWKEADPVKHSSWKEIFTISGTSIAASASTIMVFLFGEKGLLLIFQHWGQGSSSQASPPASSLPAHSIPLSADSLKIISVLHICLIAFVIAWQFARFGGKNAEPRNRTVIDAVVDQFWRGWIWIWASWGLLYLWMLVGSYIPSHSNLVWSIADAINVMNGIGFFYCFLVLDEPDACFSKNRDKSLRFARHVAFVVVVGLTMAALATLGRTPWGDSFKYTGPLAVGCYTGLSMAYLFGRFDSHYMRVPRLLLLPFYLYVVIRLGWFMVSAGLPDQKGYPPLTTMGLVVLGGALILKIPLFMIVSQWLREGTLYRYIKNIYENSSDSSESLPGGASLLKI